MNILLYKPSSYDPDQCAGDIDYYPDDDIIKDAINFVEALVKGVVNIVKTGNIMDLVIVAGLAVSGNWAMLANYAIARAAIPAVTAAAADMGWISYEVAAYLNIAGAIAVAYFNPAGMMGLENAGIQAGVASGLQSMGVSAATATSIASTVATIAPYAAIAYTAYGIYETVQAVKDMQMQYLAALAAFEAWKADFERAKSVSEGNHIEGMSFATGDYYKKLPGQDLYHIFMPGREAYVCMEAVEPAYWIENRQSPFTTDREIVSMTWDERLPMKDRWGL